MTKEQKTDILVTLVCIAVFVALVLYSTWQGAAQ